MWSLVGVKRIVKKRLTKRAFAPLQNVADKSWTIAPAETQVAPRAFYLSNQLERVTGWVFTDEHPRREMEGGFVVEHKPTRGFLVKNAWLVDGAISKGDACTYLCPRPHRWPQLHIEREIKRGAVFCSFGGNKWFAQWLLDDCVTYPLALTEGLPVTVCPTPGPHLSDYQRCLKMQPTYLQAAFFHELVFFEDISQNNHRRSRFHDQREQLLSRVKREPHPGVFIIRGLTGEKRHLLNEREVADYLQARRGFRILDPAAASLETILAACAGAKVVVGVEGSGLAHGAAVLMPGGAILTLQPPNRFVKFYKPYADCNRQHFGFVVGVPKADGFVVDPVEVEKTLDLFPSTLN